MSFWRVFAGRVDANTVAEVKVDAAGVVQTAVTNLPADSFVSKLANAIKDGKAFVSSVLETVPNNQFLSLFLTIPANAPTLYVFDWVLATPWPGELILYEGAVEPLGVTALTFNNRNRNSAVVTSAALKYKITATDPAVGGAVIYSQRIPSERQDGDGGAGNFIGKNNTVYAVVFDLANLATARLSAKLNLSEVPA